MLVYGDEKFGTEDEVGKVNRMLETISLAFKGVATVIVSVALGAILDGRDPEIQIVLLAIAVFLLGVGSLTSHSISAI